MKHIHLQSVGSTNSYMKELLEREPSLPQMTIVSAFEQSSGRGQRGNSWEAAPGQNLSCSILLRPQQRPEISTFDLNVVTSLALRDLLIKFLPHKSIKVKWPNDILILNRKIAGILIENEWLGSEWTYAIVGIGLNVLQEDFANYTPQATSIAIEGGKVSTQYEVWHLQLIEQLAECLERRLDQMYHALAELRLEYHQNLYAYLDPEQLYTLPSGEQFRGQLIGVKNNGLLTIEKEGKQQLYAFKEIKFEI